MVVLQTHNDLQRSAPTQKITEGWKQKTNGGLICMKGQQLL